MKKAVILAVSIALGIIGGITLNYFVVSEIVSAVWQGGAFTERILNILLPAVQSVLISGIIYSIAMRGMSKYFAWTVMGFYAALMLLMLFMRFEIGRRISLDIGGLFDSQSFLTNFFNFICFLPAGVFYKRLKPAPAACGAVLTVFVIEAVQLALQRGIFDVTDIIIDSAAIFIGSRLACWLWPKIVTR